MSVSVEVMKLSDSAAVAEYSSAVLMRRAGEALAELVMRVCRDRGFERVIFINGKGNNGGDGFVAASVLCGNVFSVEVYADASVTEEGRRYRDEYIALMRDIGRTEKSDLIEARVKTLGEFIARYRNYGINNSLVVDCLLGTGIKGDLRGDYAEAVNVVNLSTMCDKEKISEGIAANRNTYVISCDMPSGLADNGRTENAMIADMTCAIACDKDAYYLNDGKDYCGIIETVDIGIKIIGEQHILTDERLVRQVFPPRKKNSHKGTYGSVGIIACSENYAGAGKLSYMAAVNTLGECAIRSGAGTVRLYVPQEMRPNLWQFVESCSIAGTEELSKYESRAYVYGLSKPVNDDAIATHMSIAVKNDLLVEQNVANIGKYGESVFAYGMGIGDGDAVMLRRLIESDAALIVDADGLNLLSRNIDLLDNLPYGKQIVLTPHVKEMSRLCGNSVEQILNDPIETAKAFAAAYRVTVLLKGSGSVITDGESVYINAAGSPCLAKGGSGDVLSGVIAAILSKGCDALKAAACGAYLLGQASEEAALKHGENSSTPIDIATAIKKIVKR